MSFILDALKKSENERQQQSDSEFATVPSGTDNPGMPRWLWVLGALLVVNAVVVTGLLLRSDGSPADTASAPAIQTQAAAISETTPAATTPAAQQSFAEQVDAARQDQAARPAPEPRMVSPEPISEPLATQRPPATAAQADNPLLLPSIQEVVATGTLQLPPMHIDIHVYSDTPGDRFVFINMNKYRESDQLDEGPVVEEITRDGVVLTHLGTEFFLSRD